MFKEIIFTGFDIKHLFLFKDGIETDEEILTFSSKNVSAFDVTSVPAPVFIPAIGSPSSGQAASAIKSFSSVATGPFFNTSVRLVVFPSIFTCSCSAFVLYEYLLSLFTQVFPSSYFSAVSLNFALFSLQRAVSIQIILCGPALQPPDVRLQASTFIPTLRVMSKLASFMPMEIPRAIQLLWAFSAIAHKDVAFTF